MKTKTLFFTLLAGAFLCFSNASYAQYHSSGGSGGSGDGTWGQGVNDINLGIGFLGNGAGNVASGASASVAPAFELSYERGLNEHWGIGLNLTYQSATATTSYSSVNYVYDPSTFTYNEVSYTNTDKYTVSLLNFDVRGAYHFSAGPKFDPYIGLALGYCDASATDNFTSTDPSQASTSSTGAITGVEFGLFVGGRYYFSDHIGAWLELQYTDASFSYLGYSTSINAADILNLGITFKF